jgi:hypothetical protein
MLEQLERLERPLPTSWDERRKIFTPRQMTYVPSTAELVGSATPHSSSG